MTRDYDGPIYYRGRPVEELSQLETALLGAWFKSRLNFEAVSFDNVELREGSDAAEGTAMDVFSTANLIAPVTGSFHPVAIAIRVGLDFLSDAALDVGAVLRELIAEKFAERYDFKIPFIVDSDEEPRLVKAYKSLLDDSPSGGGPPSCALPLRAW